jgi:hypothetical protein
LTTHQTPEQALLNSVLESARGPIRAKCRLVRHEREKRVKARADALENELRQRSMHRSGEMLSRLAQVLREETETCAKAMVEACVEEGARGLDAIDGFVIADIEFFVRAYWGAVESEWRAGGFGSGIAFFTAGQTATDFRHLVRDYITSCIADKDRTLPKSIYEHISKHPIANVAKIVVAALGAFASIVALIQFAQSCLSANENHVDVAKQLPITATLDRDSAEDGGEN